MFHCERCKSSFKPSAAAALSCPRCKVRDGVESPLHFRLFERSDPPVAAADAPASHLSADAGPAEGPAPSVGP
jgi:hypothetical protein